MVLCDRQPSEADEVGFGRADSPSRGAVGVG